MGSILINPLGSRGFFGLCAAIGDKGRIVVVSHIVINPEGYGSLEGLTQKAKSCSVLFSGLVVLSLN
jgi:hypothetical protein